MKYTYLLTITYDGTNYCGWQIQPNNQTLQELIQNALEIILKEKISLIGASRTDSGVHAFDQKAHFRSDLELDLRKTTYSLNGILPKDIRIIKIEKKDHSFHARYSAKSKTYHYFVNVGHFHSPFDNKYSFHFTERFDLPLILLASKKFIGTHDFTSFSNDHLEGSAKVNPIKTIYELNIKKIDENKVLFEFKGDGFLYKMVRNIVGTLLDISSNKISIDDLPKIFEAKDRKKAGRAAPAKGLFLVKVDY